MASMTSKAKEATMREIQAEYNKFLNLSKKKISNEEKESSEQGTKTSNYTKKVAAMTKSFSNVMVSAGKVSYEKTKQGATTLSQNVTMPTIWKSPEPLKRPDGLRLGIIGVGLFSGNEIVSKAIRRFTKSKYSHVAILMCDVTKPKKDQDGWYVYSANGSAGQILDQHRFPQVQLEKWNDSMPAYNGAAGTRLISYSEGGKPDSGRVTELVDKYLGLPYETQLLVMLKALNRSNVESEGHAESAFCSEICYRFLVSLGVLDDTEVPENVWPKDFSDENDKLPLRAGVWGDLVVHKGQF